MSAPNSPRESRRRRPGPLSGVLSVLAAGLAVGGFGGCGGEAAAPPEDRGVSVPQPGIVVVPPEPPAPDAGVEPPPPPEMEPDEPEPFEDPGCPPIPPQNAVNECDPLATPSGCGPNQACYPYVRYPEGPCGVESFGTICAPEGSGTQGDSCSRSGCAADHICVSTGRGTRCVRLCDFADNNECPPGLLCLPIDIEGFGGCL